MTRPLTIACLTALTTGCSLSSGPAPEVRSFSLEEEVTQVYLSADAGSVRVLVGDDHSVTQAVSADEEPRLREQLTGGVLTISAECDEEDEDCWIDHTLVLPAGVDVELDLGAGDVEITGIAGDLRVETGAGHIGAWELRSPTVIVDSGAGDLTLEHTERPTWVSASTGAGDVELTVPTGAYECVLRTGMGTLEIDGILCTDEADAGLSVESTAGDVGLYGS